MQNSISRYKHPVVCFGEILWDILPSGATPGGAPMNVAYHLFKLNKNPALLTRIGIDERGQELMNIFSEKGVCTDFFQVDDTHETGKVLAKTNAQGDVVYDILMPVAWDFIKWDDDFSGLLENAEYFVFGSLAARNKFSKDTLFSLLEKSRNNVLDINLRTPHFNRHIVEQLLQKTDFLKMNLDELELITGWFSNHTGIEDRLKSIRDKFSINNIVVTMGSRGALLYRNENIVKHNGFCVDVSDTIGSGDAFLAGLLSQLLDNVEGESALEFACGLGAFIATRSGACPDYNIEDINSIIHNENLRT